MRFVCVCLLVVFLLIPAPAQETTGGPTGEKARKSYKEAMELLKQGKEEWALESFKKADKQDGGHCANCQKQMMHYGIKLADWKTAELGAEELVASAQGDRDTAIAHYQLALVLWDEGAQKHKDEYFARAHEECLKAIAPKLKFPDAVLLDGKALAQLHQDAAAKERFEQYLKMQPEDDPNRQRAVRYVNRPELARARMAPPFAVTTIDGKRISMDELQGKVVLLDFWATWCEPCREALPHIRNIAKKFQGEPLVILSVSLDDDEQKWKDFVAKNEMTWPQCRDGGFKGTIATMFGVTAIPHTFTIDSDSVLQEEHIGDASIEGKLKKLLAQAREMQKSSTVGK
ncbi:MAG TPA: redoxin domain-containing protein [Candidatus Acidoferrum sp.]|nr:redoxin domain-containing protein [Candidatus Acidoferrum sp.]